MSKIAEELEELYEMPGYGTTARKLDVILSELDAVDKTALGQVLEDKDIPSTAIGTLLRKNGYDISNKAVQNYRKEVTWA